MSIPFSGTRSRGGLFGAIIKQLRTVNLKPVKKIDISFDPFHEHAKATRQFLSYITSPKIIRTNPLCSLKTNIASDLSEPTITFNLQSGDKVILKTTLLSPLNILELYNKHITPLIPPDPIKVQEELELQEKKKKRKRQKHKIKEGSKRRGVKL